MYKLEKSMLWRPKLWGNPTFMLKYTKHQQVFPFNLSHLVFEWHRVQGLLHYSPIHTIKYVQRIKCS
jgi:hypothetical protein